MQITTNKYEINYSKAHNSFHFPSCLRKYNSHIFRKSSCIFNPFRCNNIFPHFFTFFENLIFMYYELPGT